MRAIALALLSAGLAAGCSQMDSGTSRSGTAATSTATMTATAASPQAFASEAAEDGLAEVGMGRLGIQKASSPEVRDYARHIVEDHSRNEQQLKTAAASSGVSLPTTPGPDEEKAMRRLSSLSGPEFDRAFMRQMVADHRETLAMYERQASDGKDAVLRAYAAQSVPALRQHLTQAEALAARIGS